MKMNKDFLLDDAFALFINDEEVRKTEEENAKLLAEIIASDPDKEPFDFNTFSKLYWRQSTVGGNPSPNSSERAKKEYLLRYYLHHPNVKTIREFAKTLEWFDARSGN